MRDPGNGADLELLHAQRARLASRLRTPRWYVVATTLAWAVAFAMPIGSRYLTGAGIGSALLAIVVFLLAQHALARASGLDLGIATWKYPSGRAWTVAIVVIILSADAVEVSLLDHRLLPQRSWSAAWPRRRHRVAGKAIFGASATTWRAAGRR